WLAATPPPASDGAWALVGGTLIDVSEWGTSSKDLADSAIVIDKGVVTAVGPRAKTPLPPRARVVSIEGSYVVPGLLDAFAGMNSQAQANAHLYMGVTSIVALDEPGGRRGALLWQARPKPHLYPLEVVGSTEQGQPPKTLPEMLAQLEDLARSGVRV